jgi:hypothetical protein
MTPDGHYTTEPDFLWSQEARTGCTSVFKREPGMWIRIATYRDRSAAENARDVLNSLLPSEVTINPHTDEIEGVVKNTEGC